MELKAKEYLKSAKHSLKIWEEKRENPKFDGSIPNECVLANIERKIKVFTNVIDYLETLSPECVLSTGRGLTKEGVKYFELVNK